MHILWVKLGGLWPANTGGRLRSFHILAELSRAHQVTVITTHQAGEDVRELRAALPQCERVISVPHSIPKWRSAGFRRTLVRSWLSSLPVDMLRSRVPAVRQEVGRFLDGGTVDVCIADFLSAVPNIPPGTGVPMVLFEHNVEHMIWRRLAKTEVRPLRRLLLEIEWRKMLRYETQACREAQLTVAVSPQDRGILSSLAPDADIRAVPTGVDTGYFSPGDIPESPAELVYVGSMDWYPNEDAVLHFMQAILPLIRSGVPEATLTVVGRNPSEKLLRAARENRVAVTGTVADVRPYLSKAAVCVVPLRIGGGTRLKIFEALAMGKAVVSTSVGAEGLPLQVGRHFLRADAAGGFAAAVTGLLRSRPRRQELGLAGRQLVREHYSWSQVSREFAVHCRRVATGRKNLTTGEQQPCV